MSSFASDAVDWAVSRWGAEVKNRPLQNIHRRSLDTTWRQMIRHFGGDDVILCGPPHDKLVATVVPPGQGRPDPAMPPGGYSHRDNV